METKILNFPTAMRLAQVLERYIDLESIKTFKTPIAFIESFIDTVEPLDYLDILRFLTGKTSENISKMGGPELLDTFYSGVEKNKIISLIETKTSLGL